MASITISNIDKESIDRLRIRAAAHGRSMEAEACAILGAMLSAGTPGTRDFAASIRARFAPFGGIDLAIAPREPIRELIDLS